MPPPSDASPGHPQGQYAAAAVPIGPPPPVAMPQPGAPVAPRLDPLPPTDEEPSPVDDEEDIELALAISQSEMFQRQQEEMKMSNQEDEDLAKAVAESLQTAGRSQHLFGGESSSMATSQTSNSQIPILEKKYVEPSPIKSQLNMPQDDSVLPSHAPAVPQSLSSSYIVEDDLDFGLANHRKWQIPAAPSSSQEGPSNGKGRLPGSPVSTKDVLPTTALSGYSSETSLSRASTTHGLDRSDSLPKYGRLYKTQTERLSSSIAAMESLQQTESDESRLVFDDAAYARQIAVDEEDDLCRRIEEKGRMEAERQKQAESERLPQYTSDGLLSPDTEVSSSSQRLSQVNETAPPPPAPVASSRPRAVSSSEAVRHNSSLPFPLNQPNYDSRPLEMPTVSSSSSISPSVRSSQAPSDRPSPPYGNLPHSNSFPSATAGPSEPSQPSQQASASAVNHNRFIDRELLTGVCKLFFSVSFFLGTDISAAVGFKPPILSNRLVAMEDPMPNIISLPATRCPPLHLQAPNWRHMLRLLARLSNSRIEATVEALSDSKTELKLRTVVQFVKVRL